MSEIIFQVSEDEADGGFTARALGHSIVTEADTWAELRESVRDAVRCHFGWGRTCLRELPLRLVAAPAGASRE